MSRFTLVGELPRHLYVWIDTTHTHVEPVGFVPAVWFGLVSYPGRAWGCTVMLESGAVYRNLPPHAISFRERAKDDSTVWTVRDAQTWDCYGTDFSVIEYEYLCGLRCAARAAGNEHRGRYLFTAAPVGDAFSASPEQAKEFSFIELINGRMTIQPTNNLIFKEKSFTTNREMRFPEGLKRQTEVWKVE